MGPSCRLIGNRSLQRSALLGWGRLQGLNGICSQASSPFPSPPQQLSHSALLPCSAVGCTVQAMPTQAFLPGSMPVPLSLRPAAREESFNALLEWQQHFSAQVHAIGNTWLEQDDGPSGDQLQQELQWVLDDTVQSIQPSDLRILLQAVQRTPTSQWIAVERWATLADEAAAEACKGRSGACMWRVRVRATAEELHALWVQRIQLRTPFQYLLNSAHWSKYVLSVGPGVLIPRPETEAFFPEFVSDTVRANPGLAKGVWLDLGTGSGAIAIATADILRKKQQDALVVAVDLSPIALAYAAHNARLCGVDRHVATACGSWFESLRLPQTSPPHSSVSADPSSPDGSTEGRRPGPHSPTATQVVHSNSNPEHLQTQLPTQPPHSTPPSIPSPSATLQQTTSATPSPQTDHISKSPQVPDQDQSSTSGKNAAGSSGSNQSRLAEDVPARQLDLEWKLGQRGIKLGMAGALRFSGILSNPPYIPRGEMAGLQPEVGRHEPWSALDGGVGSGMTCLDPICRGAVEFLLPGGVLALETAGGPQANEVAELLRSLTTGGKEAACGVPDCSTTQDDASSAVSITRGSILRDFAAAFENVTVEQDCYGVGRFVTAVRTNSL